MGRTQASKKRRLGDLPSPTSELRGLRTTLFISIWMCLIGMVTLFGGTRFWAAGPFWIPILLCLGIYFFYTVLNSRRNKTPLCLPADFYFWTLILLYVGVRAALFTPIPYETWTEWMFLLTAWFLYGAMCDLGNKSSSLNLGAVLLLAAVLIHSLVAISQHWHGDRMVLWIPRPEQYGMRASGTFICPNHFAHFLHMGMVLAFALVLTPKLRLWIRIFAAYVLIPSSIALLLTQSRSGLAAAFAGMGIVIFGKVLRRSWKTLLVFAVSLPAVAAGCFYALLYLYPPMKARMGRDLTHNIRQAQIWPDTWSMIKGEGFWGAGPGVYIDVFEKYREHFSSSRLYLEYAHNEYLNTLAEYGWVASAAFLILIGWMSCRWLIKIVKTTSDQSAMIPITMLALFAATFIHALFDFNLHIPSNGLLFVALIGWLTGQGFYRHVWKKPSGSLLKTQGFALSGVLLCLVLLPFVFCMMVGSWFEHKFTLAEKAGDTPLQYTYAAKMRSWTPWYAKGWTELGDEERAKAFWLQEEDARRVMISASRTAYLKALEKNAYETAALMGLVKLDLLENQPEKALDTLLQLLELKPFDQNFQIRHGLILRQLGRPGQALSVFEQAQRLDAPHSKQIELNIRRLRKILQEQEKGA